MGSVLSFRANAFHNHSRVKMILVSHLDRVTMVVVINKRTRLACSENYYSHFMDLVFKEICVEDVPYTLQMVKGD